MGCVVAVFRGVYGFWPTEMPKCRVTKVIGPSPKKVGSVSNLSKPSGKAGDNQEMCGPFV
jgi:hypothetical protein